MAKIPFSIEHRKKIENGEYKVETRDGKPTRIVCWDLKGNEDFCILALVEKNEKEVSYCYPITGCCKAACDREGKDDLFIITPEPELTEFEQSIKDRFFFGELAIEESEIKEIAAELLTLARKQLQPEIDAEIEKAYKTADEVQYRKGREEALKDLPRWKPSNCPRSNLPSMYLTGDGAAIYKDGYEISISSLEKLPKEE